MPYQPPLPPEMPGEEAIRYIQQAEGCSEEEAIDQLQAAITDGAVHKRIPDGAGLQIKREIFPKDLIDPPPNMVSPGFPLRWAAADIRADGTVGWGSKTRCRFWVGRDDIMQIWPPRSARPGNAVPATPPNKPGAPSTYDKVVAILDQLYANEPKLIDQSDGNFKLLGYKIREAADKGERDRGWGNRTLRNHVKTWRQSKLSPE
jgi:hypothetical protein